MFGLFTQVLDIFLAAQMVSLTQASGFDCYVCLHLHGTIVTQRDKVENWEVQILKCVKGLEPPRVHREPLSTACLSGLGEFSLAWPLHLLSHTSQCSCWTI